VSGVPVVLPRSGGVLSFASDETAWLVRPDAPGLAEGLVECLMRADEARRRCDNAAVGASAWSWAGAATRYFEAVAALDHRRRTEWAPDDRRGIRPHYCRTVQSNIQLTPNSSVTMPKRVPHGESNSG
jgi:hypothetical protein